MASVRWLWFDYSDPRLPISRRQRAELWARMMVRAQYTQPYHLIPMVLAMVLGPLVAVVTGSVLVLIGFGVAAWISSAWIGRWSFRLPLRLAQRDLDLESCAHCGYWFRGMKPAQRTCPECGRPIVGVSPYARPSRRLFAAPPKSL
jgi:hypothetical protein